MGLIMTVDEARRRIISTGPLRLREITFDLNPEYKTYKRFLRAPQACLSIRVAYGTNLMQPDQPMYMSIDDDGIDDRDLQILETHPETVCLGSDPERLMGRNVLEGHAEQQATILAKMGNAVICVSDGENHLGGNIYPDEIPALAGWLHEVFAKK